VDRLAVLRLSEAKAEAALAAEFLQAGAIRNAAGKAFQAWKAYISYLAIRHRRLLAEKFKGTKKLPRGEVDYAEWAAATAPTSRLLQIAAALEAVEPGVSAYTALALQLHEYQYNGPDPSGVLSKFPDDESAKKAVAVLLEELKKRLGP